MAELVLPAYPARAHPPFTNLLKGVLDFDQYDDWLPDPVYGMDHARTSAPFLDRLSRSWQQHRLSYAAPLTMAIPRRDSAGFLAAVLPLDVRLSAHAVVAAMAPRIGPKLPRDKVFGFEYRADDAPFFSPPGDGLDRAWMQLREAALFDKESRIFVIDVSAFQRTASFDTLAARLREAGTYDEEIRFLGGIARLPAGGLPSIDDAFAFVYNFYLRPIDLRLFDEHINFVRYRDEYLVIDTGPKAVVEALIQKLGFGFRPVTRAGEGWVDLADRWNPSMSLKAEKVTLDLIYGNLVGVHNCDTYDRTQKRCVTDYHEIKYRNKSFDGPTELFRLRPQQTPFDGLEILPILRAIHADRAAGVLLRPPFARAPQKFLNYRRILASAGGRRWLTQALQTAINTRVDWQLTWVAPLLSDCDSLNEAEIRLLRSVLNKPAFSPAVAWQVRLALARSSHLAPQDCWVLPAASEAPYIRRAAMLAAAYFAQRQAPAPWTAVTAAGFAEPELQTLLASAIVGTA